MILALLPWRRYFITTSNIINQDPATYNNYDSTVGSLIDLLSKLYDELINNLDVPYTVLTYLVKITKQINTLLTLDRTNIKCSGYFLTNNTVNQTNTSYTGTGPGIFIEYVYNKLITKLNKILSKIKYLDLSTNELTKYPNIKAYKNIIYLSIGRNLISGSIIDNNLIELTCDYNKISKIESSSITKLSANNNELKNINVPNVKVLHINNNKITELDEYFNLEYLECIENEISSIKNLKYKCWINKYK